MITMTPDEARAAILAGTAPDHLTVGRSLDLERCTSLTSLPPGLTVGGWLGLDGCTGLTSLPPGLTVGVTLSLQGCTGLTSMPPGLTVGRLLYLDRCTGLAHLCVGQDRRGHAFHGIQMADGLHVVAGCRNFLLEAAKHHWADNPECLALVHLIEQRFLVTA